MMRQANGRDTRRHLRQLQIRPDGGAPERNQVITVDQVYDLRPKDNLLLVPGVPVHEQRLSRTPELVAVDAGFYSAQAEAAAQNVGVKLVSVPNHSTKSRERREIQKQRWFRKGTRMENRLRSE